MPGDDVLFCIDGLVEELERITGEGREQEDDITLLTLWRCAA